MTNPVGTHGIWCCLEERRRHRRRRCRPRGQYPINGSRRRRARVVRAADRWQGHRSSLAPRRHRRWDVGRWRTWERDQCRRFTMCDFNIFSRRSRMFALKLPLMTTRPRRRTWHVYLSVQYLRYRSIGCTAREAAGSGQCWAPRLPPATTLRGPLIRRTVTSHCQSGIPS